MRYRTIGSTGVKVSEIGFGCGNNAVLDGQSAITTSKLKSSGARWMAVSRFSTPRSPTAWASPRKILGAFSKISASIR